VYGRDEGERIMVDGLHIPLAIALSGKGRSWG
jgi:hypothetical protein